MRQEVEIRYVVTSLNEAAPASPVEPLAEDRAFLQLRLS
jgi:hypothetical protein